MKNQKLMPENSENKADKFSEERERLEIEKLEAEIANLKKDHGLAANIPAFIPIFTVLIAVVGVVVGIWQFNKQQDANNKQQEAQQKHNRDQLEAQSKRDAEAKNEELKKRYWEEQIKTYKEAIDAAALISKANSLSEVKNERKTFWRLYWGNMSLVENVGVEKAMQAFGRKLKEWEETNSKPLELEGAVYWIAHCGRESLLETWDPLDNLKDSDERQCPYTEN